MWHAVWGHSCPWSTSFLGCREGYWVQKRLLCINKQGFPFVSCLGVFVSFCLFRLFCHDSFKYAQHIHGQSQNRIKRILTDVPCRLVPLPHGHWLPIDVPSWRGLVCKFYVFLKAISTIESVYSLHVYTHSLSLLCEYAIVYSSWGYLWRCIIRSFIGLQCLIQAETLNFAKFPSQGVVLF